MIIPCRECGKDVRFEGGDMPPQFAADLCGAVGRMALFLRLVLAEFGGARSSG